MESLRAVDKALRQRRGRFLRNWFLNIGRCHILQTFREGMISLRRGDSPFRPRRPTEPIPSFVLDCEIVLGATGEWKYFWETNSHLRGYLNVTDVTGKHLAPQGSTVNTEATWTFAVFATS